MKLESDFSGYKYINSALSENVSMKKKGSFGKTIEINLQQIQIKYI